ALRPLPVPVRDHVDGAAGRDGRRDRDLEAAPCRRRRRRPKGARCRGGARRARAAGTRRVGAGGGGVAEPGAPRVIPISWTLLLSALVFTIGMIGVLVRRN